jgi:hypothetical protein
MKIRVAGTVTLPVFYNFGGTDVEAIHSLNGCQLPHSGQDVAAY